MAIVQISKIQQRSGNLVDLPQLDEAEFGWASDAKLLYIGKTTPNENVEVLTSYSHISFSQLDGSVGNLNISDATVANGQVLAFDGTNWVNKGGDAGGLITLGSVSNVKITGGAIGYVLETDGTGNLSWTPKGTISASILSVTNANPGVVTTTTNNLFTDGLKVTITDARGMTQLNGNTYYADVISSNTFALYSDASLSTPVNTSAFTAYAYTNVSNTYSSNNALKVGNSSSFTVNYPVMFVGDMTGTNLGNTATYYIKTIPSSTAITVSAELLPNGVAGNVVVLANATVTANVYGTGGRILSSLVSSGGGGGNAAGSTTSVQYNAGGLLGGSADFTFDNSTKIATVNGNINTSNVNASNAVTASRFVSNVATGTAPLTVTSTTLVPNLYVARANISDYSLVSSLDTGIYYPTFVTGNAGSVYKSLVANGIFSANLANGSLSATTFVGNLTGGANTANTVVNATQPNITGVSTSGGTFTVGNLSNSGVFFDGQSGVTLNSKTGAVEGAQLTFAWKGVSGITGQANATWNMDVDSANNYRIFYQNATGGQGAPITAYSSNSDVVFAGNTTTNGNINTSGNVVVSSSVNAPYVILNTYVANNRRTGLTYAANGLIQFETGVDVALNNSRNYYIYDSVSAATRLLIDPAGNVGISNGAPAHTLAVSGTLYSSGNAVFAANTSANNATITNTLAVGANLNVTGNTNITANANITGNLNVTNNARFTGSNVSLGGIGNVKVTGGSSGFVLVTDGTGNLTFANPVSIGTQPAGSNTQVQFNDAGALGATSSFTFNKTTGRLDLAGNVALTQTRPYMMLNATSGADRRAAVSYLSNGNGQFETGVDISTNNARNYYIFDSVAAATRFLIDPNGNIGINQASPTAKLDVDGTINATGNITGGNLVTTKTVGAGNLTVTNNATIGGNLSVTNNVSFTGSSVSLGGIGNVKVTGGSSGFVLVTDGTGNLTFSNPVTIGTQPAGANTQVQFNDGGSLGAVAGFTFTKSNSNLYSAGNVTAALGLYSATLATSGNATLGGNVTVGANAFITVSANIGGALDVSGAATLKSNLVVTGNVTSSTGRFIGNGSTLTSLTGANVTGYVPLADYATNAGWSVEAGNVTTNAQPNITSVGTLTSLNSGAAVFTSASTPPSVDAATPNNGSTGGVRIRANAIHNTAILQFTDKPATAEWGYLSVNSAGNATWSGAFKATGTFYGSGAGLTNIPGSSITSVVANATYATNSGTASSVAWTNVSGRPTSLSSFTNDVGYITTPVPSGTNMLFYQASAPTGWTKVTTSNDAALRVVSGAGGGTGGTVGFSAAFTSQAVNGTVGYTTLTIDQIPPHTHGITRLYIDPVDDGGSAPRTAQYDPYNPTTETGSTGGGQSHTHTFSGTNINLAVKYIDVIVAYKN